MKAPPGFIGGLDLDRFIAWLRANGAEVLERTNPYEAVRFLAGGATSIICRNGRGRLTYRGQARKAYGAFCNGASWRAVPRTARKPKTPVLIRTLMSRDGPQCFYCGRSFAAADPETLEHFVAATNGGTNHLSNLALAHRACNARASHLSVAEKVRLRDQMRGCP